MSSDVASAILNEVLELTRAVETLKIKSCAEYESARKRFEDARKETTKDIVYLSQWRSKIVVG